MYIFIYLTTISRFWSVEMASWLLCWSQGVHTMTSGDSTNDIAHLLGMLDPWYERNTLSLLNLPPNVVCQVQLDFFSPIHQICIWLIGWLVDLEVFLDIDQLIWLSLCSLGWSFTLVCVALQQTSKTESNSYENPCEQRLPILADLVLYYCRYAARPALIQLYQAEVRHLAHSFVVGLLFFSLSL